VFDELIENPGWLLNAAGDLNANLKLALEAVFGVLQTQADARLSDQLAIEIMEAVLRAVALRKELLNKVPNEARPIVAAALEAVIATIFRPGLPARAAWQLVRSETIAQITELVLDRLAANKVTAAQVAKIQQCMDELVAELDANRAFDLDAFAAKLETKLTE
jgi:cobalamin biosynthesis Mg chelatase CobN